MTDHTNSALHASAYGNGTALTEELKSRLIGISRDSLATYNPTIAGLSTFDFDQLRRNDGTPDIHEIPQLPIEHEFELKTVLARGGMGEVWHATQGALKREIAVKTLLLSAAKGNDAEQVKEYEKAFHAEAILTANLSHPNILPIHDLGKSNKGNLLLAMKLVRGITWEKQLKQDFNTMEEGKYVRTHLNILMDVCKALRYAHARGVIHRDLKPHQVMVGEFGEVQLMDWGLGLIFDSNVALQYMPSVFDQTAPSEILIPTSETCANPAGTPCYMAPEQCNFEHKRLGPWTDIFLVGAIIYRMLTGRAPFASGDSVESLVLAQICKPTPMREAAPNRWIPWELENLVAWCMNPEPANRPVSIEQVMGAMSDYLSNAERRWDSADLTQNVERSVGSSKITAAYLSGLSTQLDQAQILWKENPAIEPLRNKVAAAFAHYVATKDPEITRALLQAEGISDRSMRDYLIAYLERAYATSMRKRWLIPDMIIFVLFMTTFLILLLFVRLILF